MRKATELANGNLKDERIYLSGFEIYRKHSNPYARLARETLHIMDDQQRIALVETRNDVNDRSPERLIRYQFGNHLGSASLELDDQGQIISYEEYTSYGSTSYQAVRSQTDTPKRYRYTGKERDEESGLYYHGARYYAAWLCMWTSCDPAGILEPGISPYRAFNDNPVLFVDTNGKQAGYGIGKMNEYMADKATKGEITQKQLDEYFATNAKIAAVGVLANLAYLAPGIFRVLGPRALTLIAKAGGGAIVAETGLDAIQTGGAFVEAAANPSLAADLELAMSIADLLSGLPTPAAELATARRSQRSVLFVGPERGSEFAAARKMEKAGIPVTTVNTKKTEAAAEFESKGGRFEHKKVQKLPDMPVT